MKGGELEGGFGAKEGEKFEKKKKKKKSKGGRRLKRSVRRGGLFLRESDTWKETKGQGQQGRRTKAEASCAQGQGACDSTGQFSWRWAALGWRLSYRWS